VWLGRQDRPGTTADHSGPCCSTENQKSKIKNSLL
jgi:hypothetical protein